MRAAITARKTVCDPNCPGWEMFLCARGLEIQRCDDCWHKVKGAPVDEDFAQLPEAIEKLRRHRRYLA